MLWITSERANNNMSTYEQCQVLNPEINNNNNKLSSIWRPCARWLRGHTGTSLAFTWNHFEEVRSFSIQNVVNYWMPLSIAIAVCLFVHFWFHYCIVKWNGIELLTAHWRTIVCGSNEHTLARLDDRWRTDETREWREQNCKPVTSALPFRAF